jgi:uncharacterized membrane protein
MASLPGTNSKTLSFFHSRPLQRLGFGLIAAFLLWLLLRNTGMPALLQWMLCWDLFCVVVLVLAWMVFFKCGPGHIRALAGREDGSRLFVLALVLLSSGASMVAVALLLFSKAAVQNAVLYLPASIGGMLLSWIMVHTTFTFHYAHMYYKDDKEDPAAHAEGLSFPEEAAPDYLDFAYFAFVIGMTFQVSDVEITSRAIRRQALLHGLLSFSLNTFVVALTVNLIAGIKA